MLKEYPLEETLLDGYEYPIALVIEVTKQGIVLSKLRYLKAVSDVINETVRCPSITMYMHGGQFLDPHLKDLDIGPMGVDMFYRFPVDKGLLNETVEAIKRGRAFLNHNNPQTRVMAGLLMEKIMKKDRINYKRLTAQEQGLILEPYMNYLLTHAGEGKRTVLQNVELVEREGVLKCQVDQDIVRYRPANGPTMELDILVVTDQRYLTSIFKALERYGFVHEGRSSLGMVWDR